MAGAAGEAPAAAPGKEVQEGSKGQDPPGRLPRHSALAQDYKVRRRLRIHTGTLWVSNPTSHDKRR
jgi:hypothetical protein